MDGNFCAERKEACDNRINGLRDFMCALFEAQEKAFIASKNEQSHAITLARAEMERRLEGMNEFRDQLTRQANTFMDIKAYNAEHKVIMKEIETLREWKAKSEGERSKAIMISWVAAFISVIAIAINVLMWIK